MLKITPISCQQVENHVDSSDPLEEGLYSWSEQDWNGWEDCYSDTFTHYIGYVLGDQFMWTITNADTYSEIIFYIKVIPYRESREVNKENFIEFVKNKTPNAVEWLFFNLDLLDKQQTTS